MKFTIYKYTCPENKIYIGLTIDPKNRKRDHQVKEKITSKDNTKFAQAIRKFGFNNFKYEEIEYPKSVEEMCEREQYWIKMFNSKILGYNMDDGGTWTQEFRHNAEKLEKAIQLLKEDKLAQFEIANLLNVSTSWLSGVKRGNKRYFIHIQRTNRQAQKGSSNKASKLTEEQVAEIQSQLASGVSRKEIQQKYAISKTLVQLIATKQAWNHVQSDYSYQKRDLNGNAKLTPEIVYNIKLDLKELKQKEVAEKYNISHSTVQQIAYGKTWKNVIV